MLHDRFLPEVLPAALHVAPEFDARIGDMRAHGGLGAVHLLGYQLGRQSFHVAQQQRGSFALGENIQPMFQMRAMLRPQHGLLGTFGGFGQRLHQAIDLAEIDFSVAPQKIDGRVAGDPGQPMGGFIQSP